MKETRNVDNQPIQERKMDLTGVKIQSMKEEKIEISVEEYEKLKQIEEETAHSRQKPFSIYDKVNIPVVFLDCVIIGGVIAIFVAIIIGIFMR